MEAKEYPVIIQGGMGVAVSGWRLAKAVSRAGQLGVVSGTALDVVQARRLQLGDPHGDLRRALDAFPFPDMAQRVLQRYFIPRGKAMETPFRAVPMLGARPTPRRTELIVVANFVEVYLAREGHRGVVGINYLEKIQLPTLPSIFGAMLAGVDYILMGAGIPLAIPSVLDAMSEGRTAELSIRMGQAEGGHKFISRFDPSEFTRGEHVRLDRPRFLPIVASATLATMLLRKAKGRVDGFVVEGPTAGGHNAPPRGIQKLNTRGEPIYGERDVADLNAFRQLGAPFWLAGSYGSPEQLSAALAAGATGVQVGTAFAFCRESGLQKQIKSRVLQMAQRGQCHVFTDPIASPAGFPFKVLQYDESLSESSHYRRRQRHCDLGFLRQGFPPGDRPTCWRCPAESIESYIAKGGSEADTGGRKCLCNALLANVGLGQRRRDGQHERTLITCGDDVVHIHRFLPTPEATSYSAQDVIDHLLQKTKPNETGAACTRA